MHLEIGQLLDNKYRIVRLLGEGGMGAVYEGENIRIRHRVAIKVLHPSVADDSAARERFEREAQAAGHIGSEHIVEVFDLGELPGGARYMVMEFLAGETLAQRVESAGRLSPAVAAPMMLQLLDGLGAAHLAGIIHRDLKPDNVFLQRTKSGGDFVKIVDFGVSKFNALSGAPMSMTRTGAVVGTPYYMSPEQVKGGKNIDHRSDLYSAGVVLFESVTGQLPFLADSFNELMFKIALEPPLDPEIASPGLDPWFASILRKATARDMADRYQSAGDFTQAIAEWMQAAQVAPLPSRKGSMSFSGSTPGHPVSAVSPAVTPPTATSSLNISAAAESLGFEKTATSGSVLTPNPLPKRRSTGVVAAIAVVMTLGAAIVGIGVVRSRASKAPPATAAAAQISAAPEPPTIRSAELAVLPPAPDTATTESPAPSAADSKPLADTNPHAAPLNHGPAAPPRHPVATPVAPPTSAAPPSASAANENSTTIKGRTIRTEL
ncbi:MAG TPA: protein kinase [Polyangiaceae bacterium]|nr:protein kinase [Polyangiaceae bacterium]